MVNFSKTSMSLLAFQPMTSQVYAFQSNVIVKVRTQQSTTSLEANGDSSANEADGLPLNRNEFRLLLS